MTLQMLENINLASLLDSSISLLVAFVCGSLIGLERQYRQRTAGLRTNVLVAIGAAIFVDMGNRIGMQEGAAHIAGYVVSGIGFLGAGVIMREDGNVRGLNTAATLWGSAAVGACAGADLVLEAMMGALFILIANTVLRPVVDQINRKPIDTLRVEATNTIYVVATRLQQKPALDLLEAELSATQLTMQTLQMHAFGSDCIQMEATLPAGSVKNDVLDGLVKRLLASALVSQAFWSPNIKE